MRSESNPFGKQKNPLISSKNLWVLSGTTEMSKLKFQWYHSRGDGLYGAKLVFMASLAYSFALFSKRNTNQSQLSLISCMLKRVDSTFHQVCHAALYAVGLVTLRVSKLPFHCLRLVAVQLGRKWELLYRTHDEDFLCAIISENILSGGDGGMKARRKMFVKLGGECELNVTINGDPMLNLCHKSIPERFQKEWKYNIVLQRNQDRMVTEQQSNQLVHTSGRRPAVLIIFSGILLQSSKFGKQ